METSQLIHFKASSPSKPDFLLTAAYGANDTRARRQLWSDLISLQPNGPWIITGDFNCISYIAEKQGSTIRNSAAMSDFNSFIETTSLVEMPTSGSEFT